MNDAFHKYEAARARLIDVLQVELPPATGAHTLGHQSVHEAWGQSSQTEDIHLKLVAPFRASPFTFLLAHLEEGSVHETAVPEDVILQCLAGRFRVTELRSGFFEDVAAGGAKLILADVQYRYEAVEEVYNIMRVSL